MLYPVAVFPQNKVIADSMNAIIQRNLTDASTSDFCIGDYGFFQRGNHIELHLICNCIDFQETEHRFLFFSLDSGTLVPYTDLFDSKERAKALERVSSLVLSADPEKTCSESFQDNDTLKWSDFTLRLYKDGIAIHPAEGICENPVQIPWTEISTYLKHSYL